MGAVLTRPCFSDATRPLLSRTRMCFIRLGSAISNGFASSPTDASPSHSRMTIARRVASDRAPNTWSSCIDWLAIKLTIAETRTDVNES